MQTSLVREHHPPRAVEGPSFRFHFAFYICFQCSGLSVPSFGQILIKMFIVKLYILSTMGLCASKLGFYIRIFSHSKKKI